MEIAVYWLLTTFLNHSLTDTKIAENDVQNILDVDLPSKAAQHDRG
jgi:hypothetical protein